MKGLLHQESIFLIGVTRVYMVAHHSSTLGSGFPCASFLPNPTLETVYREEVRYNFEGIVVDT